MSETIRSFRSTRGVGWKWRVLGALWGPVALGVCMGMDGFYSWKLGTPTLMSDGGIVKLYSMRYHEAQVGEEDVLRCADGTEVGPDDLVFDFHLASQQFAARVLKGESWLHVLRVEFESLAPKIKSRGEKALVGTTILRVQAAYFGARIHELPPSLHLQLDTFYRKFFLMAFHPGGIGRVLKERKPVARAVISRTEFCRRFTPRTPL